MTATHERLAVSEIATGAIPVNTPPGHRPTRFDDDPFPGARAMLFIGPGESTHTHAWIDLLAGAELNVRLFALPGGVPPDEWGVRTYVSAPTSRNARLPNAPTTVPGVAARARPEACVRASHLERARRRAAMAGTRHSRMEADHHPHARNRSGGRVLLRYATRPRAGANRPVGSADPRRLGPRARAIRRRSRRLALGNAACARRTASLSDNPINFEIARGDGRTRGSALADRYRARHGRRRH